MLNDQKKSHRCESMQRHADWRLFDVNNSPAPRIGFRKVYICNPLFPLFLPAWEGEPERPEHASLDAPFFLFICFPWPSGQGHCCC